MPFAQRPAVIRPVLKPSKLKQPQQATPSSARPRLPQISRAVRVAQNVQQQTREKTAMFRGLRLRLLVYQLSIISAILAVFGGAVYSFLSYSIYDQLDKKLRTLAQSATPVHENVQAQGEDYFNQVDEVPWRDIFNRDRQTLEWFDATGQSLTRRGSTEVYQRVRTGARTAKSLDGSRVRTFTVSVFEDTDEDTATGRRPSLVGYVRASQSLEDIHQIQQQLLGGLTLGGFSALVLAGIGGLWLTQRSLRPVETSYRRLRQFTADASHELRGPLTAIRMSVDVMQRHPERVHPKDVKKLGAIASATDQMSDLAEDLLLLARMDSGQSVIPRLREAVELGQLLRELLVLREPAASAKDLSFMVCCPQPLPISGDSAQLHRLFANLLDNAIQYTLAGGRIMIILEQQRRSAWVKIQDTGIGIAPEDLPYIFDRFWRADPARNHRAGGSGLGLAIVQAIVQQHQGKISVTSTVGKGTSFQVVLPMS